MANAKEVALGIASALGSEHAPDPLPISFRGQSLSEASTIVLAILAECRDAGIALDRVQLDPELYREATGRAGALEAELLRDGGSEGAAVFYRRSGYGAGAAERNRRG